MTSPLLGRPGAVAGDPLGPDAGVAWHYGDPFGEQRALASGHGVVDQSHLGAIRVEGEDRLTWLNDLTTQKLDALEQGCPTEALVLSPQGHIEHAAAVVEFDGATWLITESPQRLADWLKSMRFRRDVRVSDESADWAVLGTSAPEVVWAPSASIGAEGIAAGWVDPWPRVLDGGTRYGPPAEQHPARAWGWRLLLVPRRTLEQGVADAEAAGLRLAGTWALEALRIAAWRPRFAAEVDHRTVPHELDWLRTAVHLKKGCYRGQETIARVHNVGKPPRRLTFLHLDGSTADLPHAGAHITVEGCEVGRVTSVTQHFELGPIALAVIKRSIPADALLEVELSGADEAPTTGPVAAAPPASVAAAQTVIVPVEGESADRPAPRGPLMPGLRRAGAMPSAVPGGMTGGMVGAASAPTLGGAPRSAPGSVSTGMRVV